MALILSLKEEQDFYVADEHFVLRKITGQTSFILAHIRPETQMFTSHRITDERSTEIMPDVFVSAGDMHQSNVASVVISAPQEILILRGDLYRRNSDTKGDA